MRKTLAAWSCLGFVLLLLLSSALVPAPARASTGTPLTVPVVFTSRNRLDTLDGKNVGPAVEIVGREKAVGGKLMVIHPDGRLVDLTSGKLYDVSRPMVSFDGTRVAFSGLLTPKSQWYIFEINLDGSGFRQLTFEDRSRKVPVDPLNPRRNQGSFGRYGDFSPAYLPDGRIVFSSSRYPSLSASCGQRALNLYVMNGDGSGMHRITTERAGAIDPYVLSNGRVIFSHWVDNMNTPAPAGSGLRPLEVEKNYAPSFWIFWSANPDGTEAGRYGFNDGNFKDRGGVFQPREMPDGRIVYTYRSAGSLLGSTLATGIALLAPGVGDGNSIKGIGDPTNLEGPHALSPTPLPDGRILFSYTLWAKAATDEKGKTTAQFNYGLYVTNDKFQEPSLVYDDPNTDELDAVAVYPRKAQILPDIPEASLISDDPGIDLGTSVTLRNFNIYADLPLDFKEIPSPFPGSIVAVDFYDDSQTFTTSEEFPLIRKQPPQYLGSVPVNPDGSFTATIPADRPIFWLMRTASGTVARTTTSSPTETFTSFVASHDYFRPGQVAQCVGCHRGHMLNASLTFKEAKTNLARLAIATVSSALDYNNSAPWRVNDNRLGDSQGRYTWASKGENAPWAQLTWLAPVTVDEVVLYLRTQGGNRVDRAVLYFSDGSSLTITTPLTGSSPVKLSFPVREVFWIRFQVEAGQGPSLGLAEMVVHGNSKINLPKVPPEVPKALKIAEGSILLSWQRNPEPYLGGYRIYYGVSPGNYTQVLDVGNVDRFTMPPLADGTTYYFAIKSYSLSGKESPGFSNEVKATFFAPRIQGISPASGPVSGGSRLTITGSHFSPRGVTVLFGGTHAQVLNSSPIAIEVLTPARPAGNAEVVVINADGSRISSLQSFSYLTD